MKIRIISFTERGYELSRRLREVMTAHDAELIFKGSRGGPETAASGLNLSEICRLSFEDGTALVFIGAAGIAVRSIAPFVRDKLQDPPVLVMDEAGRFVIPVLSGHVGGANELAAEIGELTGAEPVITTATDVNETFAVDLFAKENGLTITDRSGIARVSSSALAGRPVTLSIRDYPPAAPVDVLITDEVMPGTAQLTLCPKKYAVGIGCRRGKSYEELREFAERILAENGISLKDAGCIATIDIKKDEEGLRQLSQAWKMPFITYEAAVLAKVQGEFSSSEAVLERVGVGNVCERAAVLAAGPGADLILRKTAENGMTIAIAERRRKHE